MNSTTKQNPFAPSVRRMFIRVDMSIDTRLNRDAVQRQLENFLIDELPELVIATGLSPKIQVSLNPIN